MLSERKLPRPRKLHTGGKTIDFIRICNCMDRRGPQGGVCGNCCYAIPSGDENKKSQEEIDRALSNARNKAIVNYAKKLSW